MTTVLQVADSVTAQLNAAEFDFEFVAERLYVPNFDLEDMKELRVSVVPRDVELLPHDRAHNLRWCRFWGPPGSLRRSRGGFELCRC
jgi:hypothetical protein